MSFADQFEAVYDVPTPGKAKAKIEGHGMVFTLLKLSAVITGLLAILEIADRYAKK